MRILIIGQGGREHALAWKIRQEKKVKKLYCAPGNGGTAGIAENIPVKPDDIKGLLDFCKKKKIDMTVVGPETPLALGIVDLFQENGLKIFGPTQNTARLEASKVFTKELCKDENIPTAEAGIFDSADDAKDFVKAKGAPLVIKADGLAAGKGVIIAKTREEAFTAIDRIMTEKEFGSSGDRIIVEECLEGEEASIMVISDGKNIVPLASSQDHKRVFDKDQGPNTGGMGAYSPAPCVTDEIFELAVKEIIIPAIKGVEKRGTPHKGVLYAGIMIVDNKPKLLEFNVRFGDPETQAVLPRLKSSLLEAIELTVEGSLENYNLEWDKRSSVCVVMASGGYPGKYEKGKKITGIKDASKLEDVIIFHAGTKVAAEASPPKGGGSSAAEKVATDGGRVLNVVALGDDIKKAQEKAYEACGLISFENMHYRKDIGYRAIQRQEVLS